MSEAESDDGAQARKKRKTSRACDRCHVQHQPCDNAAPKCGVCDRVGAECTYNRPIRKRGPRAGYTTQYGDRLWGLVLKANPEIEDTVLHMLAKGTFGDTGIPNAEYFRNNSQQSEELVRHFKESRLGRFVQDGELPDPETLQVSLPVQPMASVPRSEQLDAGPDKDQTDLGRRSRRATVCGLPKASNAVNPHGPPQNPGEIYTLSDDLRRSVFHPEGTNGSQHHASPQASVPTPGWSAFSHPLDTSNASAFAFEHNGFTSSYDALPSAPNGNERVLRAAGIPSLDEPDVLRGLKLPAAGHNPPVTQPPGHHAGFDISHEHQWYGSIPAETLLNLGFSGGEGMAEEFRDLCENPDPVNDMSNYLDNYGEHEEEDEETVWRNLVMRGRFT